MVLGNLLLATEGRVPCLTTVSNSFWESWERLRGKDEAWTCYKDRWVGAVRIASRPKRFNVREPWKPDIVFVQPLLVYT